MIGQGALNLAKPHKGIKHLPNHLELLSLILHIDPLSWEQFALAIKGI